MIERIETCDDYGGAETETPVEQRTGSNAGAVADFGRSQRSAIPGVRGSCRAVRFRSFRSAVARQEPRPPRLTIIRDCTPRMLFLAAPAAATIKAA